MPLENDSIIVVNFIHLMHKIYSIILSFLVNRLLLNILWIVRVALWSSRLYSKFQIHYIVENQLFCILYNFEFVPYQINYSYRLVQLNLSQTGSQTIIEIYSKTYFRWKHFIIRNLITCHVFSSVFCVGGLCKSIEAKYNKVCTYIIGSI